MATAVYTHPGVVQGPAFIGLGLAEEHMGPKVGRGRDFMVLIAHEPCDFRDDLSQLLVDAGYRVRCADDHRQALNSLCRERETKPNVLVLDEGLPGMAGTQTLRTAHMITELGRLRIVLLSDVAIDEDVLRQLKVGDILRKPVAPVEVLNAIQRLNKDTA